jgi:hypothetical protein
MLAFPEYSKIKNKYCIAYHGHSNEYVARILYVLPFIEKELPGMEIFVLVDEDVAKTNKSDKLVTSGSFAYTRELNECFTIEDLLRESNIQIFPIVS